jgi:hypothetical protein
VPGGIYDEPQPLAVVVGFRLTSGDIGAVNGVRVTYKLDGKTKHTLFKEAYIVCTEKPVCTPSKGKTLSDFEEESLNRFGLLPKK